jgi:hypothetical protein
MAGMASAAAPSPQSDGQREQGDAFDTEQFDVQRYVNTMFPSGEADSARRWIAAAPDRRCQAPAPCTRFAAKTFATFTLRSAESSLVDLDPLVITLRQKVRLTSTTC